MCLNQSTQYHWCILIQNSKFKIQNSKKKTVATTHSASVLEAGAVERGTVERTGRTDGADGVLFVDDSEETEYNHSIQKCITIA